MFHCQNNWPKRAQSRNHSRCHSKFIFFYTEQVSHRTVGSSQLGENSVILKIVKSKGYKFAGKEHEGTKFQRNDLKGVKTEKLEYNV